MFINRLAYLESAGVISPLTRLLARREVRKLLAGLRQLGATGPGGPAAGLSDQFALHRDDVPAEAGQPEPGRDLPAEIMGQLCGHLDMLTSPQIRGGRGAHRRGARDQRGGGPTLVPPARPPRFPKGARMNHTCAFGIYLTSRREHQVPSCPATLRGNDGHHYEPETYHDRADNGCRQWLRHVHAVVLPYVAHDAVSRERRDSVAQGSIADDE